MKILKLYFKNINSLEGESRIDFRRAPFSDAGVFAITGPNGSGKTSILDAITLGLYGETFRFDRPAMHVMTRHTAECFSEVEFQLNDNQYKSTWRVKRKNNEATGALMSPEMALLDTTSDEDVVLADTPHSVCQKIAEITGMNFRNFTRSIMLAQGDFAAFLNALDNERLDILEKIISHDIYEEYKNNVIARSAQEENVLTSLTEDVASMTIMAPEQMEACEHDLQDFKEQFEEAQELQAAVKKQQHWLQQIETIELKISDVTGKIEHKRKEADENKQQLNKMTAATEAGVLNFKDDCDVLEQRQKELEDSRLTLAAYRTELKQLQDKLVVAGSDNAINQDPAEIVKSIAEQQAAIAAEKAKISEYTFELQAESKQLEAMQKQLSGKQAVLETVNQWLEDNSSDENLIDDFPATGKLKSLKTQIADLTEKHKSSAKWAKNTNSELNKTISNSQKNSKRVTQLKRQIQIEEQKLEAVASGHNAEQLNELLKDQAERLKDFEELYNLSRSHARLTGGTFRFLSFGRNREDQSITRLKEELSEYKDNFRHEENIRKALSKAISNEALLQKMSADRHELVDGKPCPLCGSLDHPYAKRPPVLTDSRPLLVEQRSKVQSIKAAMDRLEQELQATEIRNKSHKAKDLRVTQIRSEWLTLCNRLNAVSEDLDINNTRLMKRLLKAEQVEFKNINTMASSYQSRQKAIENNKREIKTLETETAILESSKVEIEAKWQGRPDEIKEIEETLSRLRLEEKELTTKVLGQLAQVNEKMPVKGKEDEFFDRLNLRRQDYLSYSMRRKTLTAELDEISEKIAHSESKLSESNEKLTTSSHHLQREETAGLHLALVEKQKLIAEKERFMAQLSKEIDSLRTILQEKMTDTSFETVQEVIEIMDLIKRKKEIEDQHHLLSTDIEHLQTRLANNEEELSTLRQPALTDHTMAEINEQLRGNAEKMDIAHQEVKHLEKQLGEQVLLQQQYQIISQKIAAQEEIVKDCRDEMKRLNQEQGGEFRRRVQIKMAEKLLANANKVLEKISGRFYLRQIPSDQGLALEIEDTYQKNTRRLPKTLSGGETFIVSLALALGLSELASNGRSVDSLFLDEGFGTLDAETLYVVISTLEGLQTHGKTVGVISHVEAVQKRIKAQLQMAKKPNGLSFLKPEPEQEIAL